MKKAFLLSIAAASSLALIGCGSSGGGGGSSVVATVNGENISRDQFIRYLTKKPTVRVNTGSGVAEAQVAEPIDFQALQDMIGQKIIMQLAKDEGVFPTDADVAKELAFRKKLDNDYVKKLTLNGIGLEMIRESIALELARENLLTKGITVTAEESEQYIKEHPQEFMEPATADLLWVFVKTKSKQSQVDNEIANGQSFASIAVRYSDVPDVSRTGGRFPQRVVDQFFPELKTMVARSEPNKVTDWIALQDGYARFYVEKKSPAKPMVLDANKKELLRRTLARKRGEEGTDLAKKVLSKLKESKINVSDATLKEAWTKAFDRIKAEGGASVAGTTTPGDTKADEQPK